MNTVRLGELCAATSLFTDLGTGQPVDHGLRTCLISMRISAALELDAETRREVFFVALLRFLGCTADGHRVAELFGADDTGLLSGMAPSAMGSRIDEILGLVRTIGRVVGYPGGLVPLFAALSDPQGPERLLDAHCEVAARLAADMGLPANVSAALDKAYARWDGRGVPSGIGGDEIPLSIRVSVVARDLELLGRELGTARAASALERRRGRAYDPTVVDVALELGVEELRRCDGELWDETTGLEPPPAIEMSERDDIRRALRALGDFADLKAPEFRGHSRRVAEIAARAAGVAGLSGHQAEALECAGLVHDLGVVAAPVRVWRSAHPDPSDVELARLHPLWSRRLLTRVRGLEGIAAVTGTHHERLDGSGFPAARVGELGRCAGLLACIEFYDERRREVEDTAAVAAEMRRLEGSGALAADDVATTLAAVGSGSPLVEIERPAGLTEREVDVIRLLARGDTNRRIGERLGISPKTVGTHVEHIYAKAGVRSRAAATLFAVDRGLVEWG